MKHTEFLDQMVDQVEVSKPHMSKAEIRMAIVRQTTTWAFERGEGEAPR